MKRSRSDEFVASWDAPCSQVGAICWRMHRGHVQILLITSRDTGRWVIPKGWPITGLTPAQSAGREAWEEAGVTGDVAEDMLAVFTYAKLRAPKEPLPCAVSVFGLRVSRLADQFPERKQRRRKWFDAAKAARKVAEPDLRALFDHLAQNPALVAPDLHPA